MVDSTKDYIAVYAKVGTGTKVICPVRIGDRANASVIAAAPDLLEACKALIDAPHQEHFAVRLNDEEMAAVHAIRAAIAKAEAP
jgi:hypothetical protein